MLGLKLTMLVNGAQVHSLTFRFPQESNAELWFEQSITGHLRRRDIHVTSFFLCFAHSAQ